MVSQDDREPGRITLFDHTDTSVPASVVRERYRHMRKHCPVAHSERYGGFDYLNRYVDVRDALHDTARFSSIDGVFIPESGLPKIPALEHDLPTHTSMRALMDRPLHPRAVRAFETTIREIAGQLITCFAARGVADLAPEFCDLLPAIVIGRLVGLDHDAAVEVRHIAMTLFTSIGTESFGTNWQHFTAFIDRQLRLRRDVPRDDYLTSVAEGTIDGVRVDAELVTQIMTAFLLGGHHSTATGIAGSLQYILSQPGLATQVVKDDSVLARAIEESLRLTTPLQLFARTVRCDTSIGGVQFTEGDRLMLNLASANRDEHQFTDPDTFDINRLRKPHLAFGGGLHYCSGQHLARAEIRIGVRTLLQRLPDIHLDGTVVELGLTGGTLMPITSLPVAFTPDDTL
jgi:cytochrome P450